MMYNRFMRLLLFFDLPMITKNDLKQYRTFLKNIKILGFYMIQESVYVKMAIDSQSTKACINKINEIKPSSGNIIILSVTENQFASINIIIGESKTDVLSTNERMVEL